MTWNVASTVPALPSSTVAFPIVRAGVASSSTIVPTPSSSPSDALPGFESATVKVSLASSRTSPTTVTTALSVVSPGAKVTVPLVAA